MLLSISDRLTYAYVSILCIRAAGFWYWGLSRWKSSQPAWMTKKGIQRSLKPYERGVNATEWYLLAYQTVGIHVEDIWPSDVQVPNVNICAHLYTDTWERYTRPIVAAERYHRSCLFRRRKLSQQSLRREIRMSTARAARTTNISRWKQKTWMSY